MRFLSSRLIEKSKRQDETALFLRLALFTLRVGIEGHDGLKSATGHIEISFVSTDKIGEKERGVVISVVVRGGKAVFRLGKCTDAVFV